MAGLGTWAVEFSQKVALRILLVDFKGLAGCDVYEEHTVLVYRRVGRRGLHGRKKRLK
jgi:hypothetical protein